MFRWWLKGVMAVSEVLGPVVMGGGARVGEEGRLGPS